MATTGDTSIVYDTVRVAADVPGKSSVAAPAWGSTAASGGVMPLDAHHRMLHEGAVLSSHLQLYEAAINNYMEHSKRFFNAADEFITSTGYPSAYENRLTQQGTQAATAAAAAAAEAAVAAATDAPGPLGPGPAPSASTTSTTTTQLAEPSPGSPTASGSSAFADEAAQPALPLQGSVGGVYLCPGVPGTPALGAVGGLTHVAPADVYLPSQHEALFRHDEQRRLVAAGRDELTAALRDRLLPALHMWSAVYNECKALLPQAEQMRAASDKARQRLEEAKRQVLEAEAALPLVQREQLEAAGTLPRVLLQASGGGSLVATPAPEERAAMYKQEQGDTDAALSFELFEKALRDKLSWLMRAGAGLKAAAAAAMGHALRSAAAQAGPGEGPGGSATGPLRAPREELLEPFPEHVLARLRGEHLPTLPQLVTADQHRLGRWGARYREAMAAHAGAAAAAAGAQMLAAAAAPAGSETAIATTEGGGRMPGEAGGQVVGGLVAPAAGTEELFRTDQAAGGTTAAGDTGVAAAAAAAAAQHAGAGAAGDASVTSSAGAGKQPVGPGTLERELQAASKEARVPLDLLAAAVQADVEDNEGAASAAGRVDVAWRLLHDASIVAAKEEAVLLPVVKQHIGPEAASALLDQHKQLAGLLSGLGRTSPSSPGFDLAVLEVMQALDDHNQTLQQTVLPALTATPSLSQSTLQQLAKQYTKAARGAPTRPHGWFFQGIGSTAGTAGEGEGSHGVGGTAAAAVAATRDALKKMVVAPAKAGVALVDAAADLARFGPGHVPGKV